MIRHFFLDKTNTIIQGLEYNTGLNPILRINYGGRIARGLIHFDIKEIKQLIEDKTFGDDITKLTFTLKMTNCFSVDNGPYEKDLLESNEYEMKRASSFDLMLTKLPMHFDAGRGYDFAIDFWENKESFLKEGSNWYCCKTGLLWDGNLKPKNIKNVKGGIYDTIFLENELSKFYNNEDSLVVSTQHFDFGDENLSMDITKYVNDILFTTNDSNFGLCLSFTPSYENSFDETIYCAHFFTDHTNTFFHPYIEVSYDEYIQDDRESFTLGKDNNLYLYVSDDSIPINLDNLPICNIDGNTYPVVHVSKGVYKAIIGAKMFKANPNTIMYDMWSNIAFNGVNAENVEMEFVTNPSSRKIKIGSSSELKQDVVPTIYGINEDESINQGDVREITVDFREKYMTHKKVLIDSAEYRLYVKDGNREVEVIPYHPIEKTFLYNFFMIYTQDLIPSQYFVDIKVRLGREIKYYKKALSFKIVNNVTNRHE